MKSTAFIIFVALLSHCMYSQSKGGVEMTFEQEHIVLGSMKKGEKKIFQYVFKNTGTDTIEIDIVSACECSTLEWTRNPIPPLGKGTIDVIFDSSEKQQSETVEVDVILKNIDPKTGYQFFKILAYSFVLTQ
ncbi:MAG TPA: DUF1573 domain-containing protein [Saprospiraceae bacterium]|nr:DUF1573 domain-containing protein [Saprospiraceae bacterium]